jgi:hypothetical protein
LGHSNPAGGWNKRFDHQRATNDTPWPPAKEGDFALAIPLVALPVFSCGHNFLGIGVKKAADRNRGSFGDSRTLDLCRSIRLSRVAQAA